MLSRYLSKILESRYPDTVTTDSSLELKLDILEIEFLYSTVFHAFGVKYVHFQLPGIRFHLCTNLI